MDTFGRDLSSLHELSQYKQISKKDESLLKMLTSLGKIDLPIELKVMLGWVKVIEDKNITKKDPYKGAEIKWKPLNYKHKYSLLGKQLPDNLKGAKHPQEVLFDSILYGEYMYIATEGSRMTGKTTTVINALLQLCYRYGSDCAIAYFKDKKVDLPQLENSFITCLKRDGFREKIDFTYSKQSHIIELSNGARIYFYNVESNVHGDNITISVYEEPQLFDCDLEKFLDRVGSSNRATIDKKVSAKQIFLYNPIGRNAKILTDMFVEKDSDRYLAGKYGNDMVITIPMHIDDNYLIPEEYKLRLKNMSEAYKKAYYDGVYSDDEDLAFPELKQEQYQFYDDRTINWTNNDWYASMDWGYKDNTVIGFYTKIKKQNGDECIVKFNELVFNKSSIPEVVKLFKLEVAKNFYNLDNLQFFVGDPSMWSGGKKGETSVADDLNQEFYKNNLAITLIRGTNSRSLGFTRIKGLLESDRLLFTQKCEYTWDTIPSLMLDKTKAGVDVEHTTHSKDHAYDELRYAICAIPMLEEVSWSYSDLIKVHNLNAI